MTYLDHNATTPPLPEVVEAIRAAMHESWANPSSVHRAGQAARQRLELARQQVADLIHAPPRQLVFTSGGTESDNLALSGWFGPTGERVLILPRTEHSAVREPADHLDKQGVRVVYVPTNTHGVIDLDALSETVERHTTAEAAVLVTAMWANNETGVLQDIAEIGRRVTAIRKARAEAGVRMRLALHTDATQAVGKVPVDAEQSGVDLMTFAGHKFHGPKGVGGLYQRRGVRVYPVQRGGPQELGRRGGTENVPAIVGLGVAAEHAATFVQNDAELARLAALRDRFESAVLERVPNTVVNSGEAARLWNTTNLGFTGLEAEAILLGLSEKGVYASAGAACSSGSLDPSPVLLAMGVPEPVAHGSVRFSLSRFTTDEEIDQAIEIIPQVIQKLGRVLPV